MLGLRCLFFCSSSLVTLIIAWQSGQTFFIVVLCRSDTQKYRAGEHQDFMPKHIGNEQTEFRRIKSYVRAECFRMQLDVRFSSQANHNFFFPSFRMIMSAAFNFFSRIIHNPIHAWRGQEHVGTDFSDFRDNKFTFFMSEGWQFDQQIANGQCS